VFYPDVVCVRCSVFGAPWGWGNKSCTFFH